MDLYVVYIESPIESAEGEKVDPRSYDGISNVDTSHTSTPDKIKGAEAYVTSVRTVVFWVSIS